MLLAADALGRPAGPTAKRKVAAMIQPNQRADPGPGRDLAAWTGSKGHSSEVVGYSRLISKAVP